MTDPFFAYAVTVILDQSELSPISAGGTPTEVAFRPDGTAAYVVCGNYVSVIYTPTGTVTANIPLPTAATGIAISPDGTTAYVAANDAIYEIEIATNHITNSISVTNPNGTNLLVYPALTPNGRYLYVPDAGQLSNGNFVEGNTVIVVDTTLIGSPITVGNVPIKVAVTHGGRYA